MLDLEVYIFDMHGSEFAAFDSISIDEMMFVFVRTPQLFSMIDMKPPISRAKMMSITKAAIKAIKVACGCSGYEWSLPAGGHLMMMSFFFPHP